MKSFRHVFTLAPDCHQASGYYRLLWTRHIYEGIRPLVQRLILPEGIDWRWARKGHDIDLTPFAPDRAKASEQLFQQIQSAHRQVGLDAVISYCFSFDLAEEVVKETIKLGVPWVNFFCDSTHMFEKVEALARVVSLNWFPETAAVDRYKALGVPALCRPYALNPAFLPELARRSGAQTVGFIGLPTSNRITQLGWLRRFGCPVEIRGHGWIDQARSPFYSSTPKSRRFLRALLAPDLGEKILRRLFWPAVRRQARGPLGDEEFSEFVRGCLVVLGLNQGKDAQGRFASYLKFRDVEFPGYGCCYLTEQNNDVATAFEIGNEVLAYRNIRDAAEQIRRVQSRPELALEIGLAGRRRVLSSHTWAVRLHELAGRL
ncbi:MAG: glycosyltransferase [Verrucomicrobia bacterium]|nr:glycosyltransferase [Verrucomicrobiota bacterium]